MRKKKVNRNKEKENNEINSGIWHKFNRYKLSDSCYISMKYEISF